MKKLLRCNERFEVNKLDDYGNTIEDEYFIVEKDSLWETDD